ncbi:MAG: ankyrin repeat domain-containing protein, partial [Simkaniaceae bacterium]|nr:ankyrin repeat domain-containing protein [Simkaniaceae bacterium]
VKKLIAEKIDLEHSGEGGFTALIMASERGHLPVVELLINKGANNIQEALKVST